MFALRVAPVMRLMPTRPRKLRYWRDRLYEAIGASGWDENEVVDSRFPVELRTIRAHNGMKLELDLTDWCQRRTYFTGRYYQEDIEELLSRLLRRGDTFVDVGANIGMVTLHAASIVGNNFWSFEPSPEIYARLVRHMELNGLKGRTFNMGLGSATGTLELAQFGRHSGKATLIQRDEQPSKVAPVQIRRGDEVLRPDGPTLIKIDVEGFEVPVLEGLGSILDGDVAVIIEVSRSWLKRAGNSAEELHAILGARGLKPYLFELAESRFNRRLMAEPIAGPLEAEQYDCLFMGDGSEFASRI